MEGRHVSRRTLLAGLGVAGAAGALAACGATPTPQVIEKVVQQTVEVEKVVEKTVQVEKVVTQVVEKKVEVTTTPVPKGKVKLVFFVWLSPEQQTTVKPIFDDFTKANPDISIEVQLAPGSEADKFQKVLLMIAAGTPPDFTMGSSEIQGYAGRNVIVDLTPYIETSKTDMTVFNKAILNSYLQYQGKLYAVPVVASAEVLTYNPDMFTKAGITVPSEKWGDKDWSWAAFIDAATKLTVTKGGKIDQFGVSSILYYMYALRWWGARFANDDVTKITADTPEMAEALQEIADLSLKYHVSPRQAEWEMFGDQDPLLSGKAAMQDMGLWSLSTYSDSKASWACASWPVVKDPLAFIYPMGFYIFTGSKNKDESWLFAKFMTSAENNLKWAQAVGRMPAIPANGEKWLKFFSDKKPDAKMHVITDMLTYDKTTTAETFMTIPKYTEILTKAITPALDPVWLGEKKAKEVLPDLQKQIEDLLKEA